MTVVDFARPGTGEPNRLMITLIAMAAVTMQLLDTTIANVALPHMQGSLGATQDQIAWVLTSYLVAAAIATPVTGWLASHLGRTRLFTFALGGFTPVTQTPFTIVGKDYPAPTLSSTNPSSGMIFIAEATVNPVSAATNRRVRPIRPASQPVTGVLIAAATI